MEFPNEIHDDADDGDFKTALEYPRWELSIAASSPPPHQSVRKLDRGEIRGRDENKSKLIQIHSLTPLYPSSLRYWTIDRAVSKQGSAGKGGTYQHVRRSCRERGLLFEDPDFPAGPQALGRTRPPGGVVWLRPHVSRSRSHPGPASATCQCGLDLGAVVLFRSRCISLGNDISGAVWYTQVIPIMIQLRNGNLWRRIT